MSCLRPVWRDPLFVCLIAVSAASCAAAIAAEALSENDGWAWPQFLGTDGDLTEPAPESWPADGYPSVEVGWSRLIGPGYSQPVVADGTVYAAYSDGADDLLAALSLEDGRPLWSYRIGETWRGVDGSDDGPISTPALAEERLFGLGPRGDLFALDRETGSELWRIDLTERYGASPANYGVATSPLVVDGLVIVQMGGGEGRSIAAFEQESGELRWTSGDDAVEYQSPLLGRLQGMRQLVAVTATRVLGLDPSEGTILWRTAYGEEPTNHSSPVVLMEGDRFAIAGSRESVAYELERSSGNLEPRELWRSRELKRSYSVPVYRDGTLYGWSGNFLAAVDAATGKRLWKSRRPGPGSLLALGDWLVVWSVEGELVFLEPSSEAYRERAAFVPLETGSLTNPVWTGSGLLVRGRDRLAHLEVRSVAAPAPVETTDAAPLRLPSSGAMGDLIKRLAEVEGEAERSRLIDRFLDEHEVPLVEEGGTVHFLYRGEGENVGLVPGVAPVDTPVAMKRVAGTDLWLRTEELDSRGAYAYRFDLGGEEWVPDPRNERRAANPMGPASLLVMPDFRPAAALRPEADPPAAVGTLETHTFRSEVMENERTVAVYTPAGLDGGRNHPLVLVTSGEDRIFGRTTEILDRVMGESVEPAIVVFVDVAPPPDMNSFMESLGSRGPLFVRMLVEELLPFLEERYPLSRRRQDRFLVGTMLPGASALAAALRYPETFAAVTTQSASLNAAFVRELERLAGATEEGAARPAIFLEWCEWDLVGVAEAVDTAASNRELAGVLEEADFEVVTEVLPGGYGWQTWSTRTEAIFERLLPGGGADRADR